MKLHIGCWKRFFPGWINIDLANYEHIHWHDVKRLPFQDNTCDVVYSSHMIEYYDRMEIIETLIEWQRVLKVGGVLRLAVPDFEAMAKLYVSNPIKYPLSSLLGPLYGRMMINDTELYHRTCFDFTSITELLHSIGFKNVRRYDWKTTEHAGIDDHSHSYLPNDPEAIKKQEWNHHTLISLNVEATK